MVVIRQFVASLRLLPAHPVIFVPALIIAVLDVLGGAGAAPPPGRPILVGAAQLAQVLVLPAVLAALYALSDQARRQLPVTLGAVAGRVRASYLRLLALLVLAIVGFIALTVVTAVGAFALTGGGTSMLMPGGGMSQLTGAPPMMGGNMPWALLALFGLLLLVVIVVGFLLQFAAVAIVVEDRGVIEGLRRSVRVVIDDPLPVIGADLLLILLGVVLGGVVVGGIIAGAGAADALVVGIAVGAVLNAVVTTVTGAYTVSIFRALTTVSEW
mgnify:FL=1